MAQLIKRESNESLSSSPFNIAINLLDNKNYKIRGQHIRMQRLGQQNSGDHNRELMRGGESNSLLYEEEKKDENYQPKDRKRMGIQIQVSISEEYEIDLDSR